MLLNMFACEIVILLNYAFTCSYAEYEPTWDSLDSRPIPSWFNEDKLGVLIYWGIYAIHGFGHSLVVDYDPFKKFMAENYPAGFKYGDLAREFKGDYFDANQWVTMFKESGMKYAILVTKSYDGYTTFPSKRSLGWNSVDIGLHRDVAGELAEASRTHGLKFGIRHTFDQSYNPLPDTCSAEYTCADRVILDLMQKVHAYKPWLVTVINDEKSDSYWGSKKFFAYLYNESPVKDYVVVNDDWGNGTKCPNGCIKTIRDADPAPNLNTTWMYIVELDKIGTGYRRNMKLLDVPGIEEILKTIVNTVSHGGIFEERLRQVGQWLSINSQSIYNTSPWLHQIDEFDKNVFYTCQKKQTGKISKVVEVYAIFFKWPDDNVLILQSVYKFVRIQTIRPSVLLGNAELNINYSFKKKALHIKLHLVNSDWAWVIQFIDVPARKCTKKHYYFNIKA